MQRGVTYPVQCCVHLKAANAKSESRTSAQQTPNSVIPITILKRRSHDLGLLVLPEQYTCLCWPASHLGHHASPRHYLGIDHLPCLLLVVDDCLQEAVDVLILAVIMLVKALISLGQVGAQLGRVVPLHPRVVIPILVVFVVGEACKLLDGITGQPDAMVNMWR